MSQTPSLRTRRRPLLALIAAVTTGLTAVATAQDSVSKIQGLPGDAVDATGATEQRNNYVVDLATFRSSWNAGYGIAPIVKASRTNSPLPPAPDAFFTNQISASSISSDLRVGVPFFGSSYARWSAQGFGVNDDITFNDPGTAVNTSGFVGNQFGFAFAEFSTTGPPTNDSLENNIIGGIVNYRTSAPSRLYVSRISAATNSPNGTCNDAQFGYGAVDANGNVHFRADGAGIQNPCGQDTIPGGSGYYFRVAMQSRNTALINFLNDNATTGDTAATVRMSTGTVTTHNVPNCVPASFGGTPLVLGSNFGVTPAPGEYVYESSPGMTTATMSHFAAGSTDHRGALSHLGKNYAMFPGSTRGTAGVMAQDSLGRTRILNVWGLAANAAPLSPRGLELPAGSITDNTDGFSVNSSSDVRFSHYYGSTAFRGGVSQLALGTDAGNNLLAAAVANHTTVGSGNAEKNLIAVARTDAAGTTTTWAVAAYTTATGGKAIHDATGTNVIGTLIPYSMLGGTLPNFGTSMSAPSFDSKGNIYFVATHRLTGLADSAVGVFRARYDRATFSYKLELLFRTGDVFHGNNSNTNWQVRFLPLTSTSGISPSAFFSGGASNAAYNGLDPNTLTEGDARTLGGMVLAATIVYDVDGDGQFIRSTGSSGTVGSPDEDYQVLLYVQPAEDCNDNGVPDDIDIADGTSTDVDANGVPDDCSPFDSFCFGDGGNQVGCTFCPCGNDAPITSPTGCSNSTGSGAALLPSGVPSLTGDTLRFQMSGGTLFSFAVLTSGANRAPNNIANPCFGLDSGLQATTLDGLRCVVTSVQRHGSRPTDANGNVGVTTNGWGPPNGPPGGLLAMGGFTLGQTRHFQVIYRENPALGCGRGQNTTQGVTIVVEP